MVEPSNNCSGFQPLLTRSDHLLLPPVADPIARSVDELGHHGDDDEEVRLRVVHRHLEEDGARVLVRPQFCVQLLQVGENLHVVASQTVHVATSAVVRVHLSKTRDSALLRPLCRRPDQGAIDSIFFYGTFSFVLTVAQNTSALAFLFHQESLHATLSFDNHDNRLSTNSLNTHRPMRMSVQFLGRMVLVLLLVVAAVGVQRFPTDAKVVFFLVQDRVRRVTLVNDVFCFSHDVTFACTQQGG